MSENKYIIDKDSLTGIADAVRDKLGVGSSIDDENAGYYPKTGYVLKFNTIRKEVARGETNVIFSISNWDEQFKTWCGKVPEKIKFIRRTAAANPYVSPTTIYCNGVEVIPSDGSSKPVEKIISYPTNGTITVTEYSGSSATTPPAITIEFLDNDENSLGIINGDTGFSYDGQTISFLTGSYNVAIPYSVADIKNNIKDYWNIPKGSLDISANGTYDVTTKASAIVSVSPSLQAKTTTISQNGSQTITPDSNYDGLSAVNLTISVPNPSTGSLEITENGTYDVTDKASAVVNVSSSGGLPPFVVPTVKWKTPRWDIPAWSDFSSIFSTQEEMLEHLIDIIPDKNQNTGPLGDNWFPLQVFKDHYGRWIPLKMMNITLPSSFTIGSQWTSLGLTKAYIQYLYDNNLAFGCSSVTNYITSGGVWYLIFDRYIIGCTSNYVGSISNYSRVLYTEA